MFVVTSKQMYNAECNAVERGISFTQLMENAGQACAKIIRKKFSLERNSHKKILVLCGKGKNGGDGFVIARALWEYGCDVTVMLACGEPKAEDSVEMYSLVEATSIEIIKYDNNITLLRPIIDSADIIVEAIFGTGFSGSLSPSLSTLAQTVNAAEGKVVAIDVPAGADCDKASVQGTVFKAYMTIAISAYKPIHIIKPCNQYCGKVEVADIGITTEDFRKINSATCFTLEQSKARAMFPKRKAVSNKGTYGHAICVCGSMRMTGAAYLSVSGALRSGAGLVTAAFPQSAYPAIAPKLTESLLMPLESNFEGTFGFSAMADIIEKSKRATALLIGCGIGFNKDTVTLVHNLIKEIKIPMIIDADGINALSTNIDILKEAQAPVIITPHPGEMSRLCGRTIAEIIANPIATAYEFARKYGITVVLKTANTVVCNPNANGVYINTTGNAGLAKGGSGDLLAGIMVSLLAQGMTPFDAATLAVYLHGLAADDFAQKTSMTGMLPSDILNYLPEFFSKFE
ncbi:MAG: NAD(P)H-hydrate dehydratase [Acutalibacteraceae bacterium]|nr:NAD(P)H-hydrate dehydratase [Acutalibacteraceae bacterium]